MVKSEDRVHIIFIKSLVKRCANMEFPNAKSQNVHTKILLN